MSNFKKQLIEWSKAPNAAHAIHIVETDLDYAVPILYLRLIHQFAECELQASRKGDFVFVEDLVPGEIWDSLNEDGRTTVRACVHYLMRNGALRIGSPMYGPDHELMYTAL